jgi:hypothetical protein
MTDEIIPGRYYIFHITNECMENLLVLILTVGTSGLVLMLGKGINRVVLNVMKMFYLGIYTSCDVTKTMTVLNFTKLDFVKSVKNWDTVVFLSISTNKL